MLYALIDTARDERLYPLVMRAAARGCLIGGELPDALARAAPYLVEMRQDEPLFSAWRDAGRGLSWGIMLRSDLPLDALRLRLKRFQVAKLPDGAVAQFRFYDPRVFATYLPTCSAEELSAWFDGVSAYLVEDAGTGAFREFGFDGLALVERAGA